MLSNIKIGNLCVFKNGQRAKVIDFVRRREAITLRFDRLVVETQCMPQYNVWTYHFNGKNVGSEDCNNIVKVF